MTDPNTIYVTKDGQLRWQGKTYPCALGKGGVVGDKTEGDGATPMGRYRLKRVMYRADKIARPECALNVTEISAKDGWCDDPTHPAYNTQVTLPFAASHEELRRKDNIYDIVVVMSHNDNPPIPYKGSAVFFHLAREGFTPTQGCVAITEEAMREILKSVTDDTHMVISL